jgi:hypothetical protein
MHNFMGRQNKIFADLLLLQNFFLLASKIIN